MSTVNMTARSKPQTTVSKTWNEATESWDESASLFEPDETWDSQYQYGSIMTARSKASVVSVSARSKSSAVSMTNMSK